MMQLNSAGIENLTNVYEYNLTWIHSFKQLLSPVEKNTLQLWLDKLSSLNQSPKEMIMRNDYIWLILMMVSSGKMCSPFNRLPPQNILPLLYGISKDFYEDILFSNEPYFQFLDQYYSKETDSLSNKIERNAGQNWPKDKEV